MFTVALIGLLFVLIGIAGLQFTYLFYFDRIDRERKKHIQDLEQRSQRLTDQLAAAQQRIDEQDGILAEMGIEGDVWADVIEDR